jgi:hypothetical protein
MSDDVSVNDSAKTELGFEAGATHYRELEKTGPGTNGFTRNPYDYPENPDFGTGIFRRKIRLEATEGKVHAALEDCNHGFIVELEHDGKKVTGVAAQHKRIPFNSCFGAAEPLQRLVGQTLDQDSKALNQWMNPQANCTHWLDLALLAVAQARRGLGVREYQVDIADETDAPVVAVVSRNGEPVISLEVADWQVQSGHYQGLSLYRGFASWANKIADEEEKEAMFVLQKGYFVASARRFDLEKLAGEPANTHRVMRGACFTYSEPTVDSAKRTSGTVRDFTQTPEQLLKFL